MRISDWSSDVCSSDLRGAAQAEWRHDHIDAAAILQTGVGQWCGLIDAAAHLVDDALGDLEKMLLIAKLDRRELKLALLFNVGLFGVVHHAICYIRVGQQSLKRAKTQQLVDQPIFQCELFAPVKRD